MKVIMISTDRGIFNSGSRTQNRLASYGKIFDELHFVVFTKKGCADTKITENVFVHPTNSLGKLFYISDAFFKVKKIIKKQKDFIVSSQDPFETGLVALFSKIFLKTKFQSQVHIDFFSPYYKKESLKQFLQVLVGPFILKRADNIRVVSNKIKNYLISELKIKEDKVYVLPVFTDFDFIKRSEIKNNLKDKYKYSNVLLMASRLVKQKGILIGIKAFERILEKHPDSCLVIVGSGPEEREIKKYVKENNISNIFFENWCEDIFSYMKTADLFLLPSLYEGWGLTVVESVVCGTPVVMTDVGCAGEFLFDGKEGLIAEINNIDDFYEKVLRLIEDKNLFSEVKNNCFESSETKKKSFEEYLEQMKKSFI